MKTPSIPDLANSINSVLAGNTKPEFGIADAFLFTFADGTKKGITNAGMRIFNYWVDLNHGIEHDGTTYYVPAIIRRGPIRTKVGLEVSEFEMTLSDLDLMKGSITFMKFARQGGLDGAKLKVFKIFYKFSTLRHADFPDGMGVARPQYYYTSFLGRFSDFESTDEGIRMRFRGDLELLNVRMPRYVFQPGCQHTLFDARCGLSKASFAAASTVASGSTATTINCGLAQAAGYFDLGTVEFSSGANSGEKRSVKTHTSGVLVLSNPLPNTPAVGDAFTAYPGCDKVQATCTTKFNNVAKFRGFPYIPAPETAY